MSKRKTVAVLAPDIAIEYTQEALSGIREFFIDRNVDVVVAHTMLPEASYGEFSYQYWSTTEMLRTASIDGYIVLTGSYMAMTSAERLSRLLDKYDGRPIVSMSIPISVENSVYTSISCKKAYENVIEHLKKEHSCKRFAFIGALQTGSIEAKNRYDAFVAACEKNEISKDDIVVMDGKFTFQTGQSLIEEYFEKHNGFDFDALLAANDRMALGAIQGIKNHGYKVPEDVKVFGYDNSESAIMSNPPLSTISQEVFEHGKLVAELLYDKLCKEEVRIKTRMNVKPVYRQSCGCTCDKKAETHKDAVSSVYSLKDYDNALMNIYHLLGNIQSVNCIDSFAEQFGNIMETMEEVEAMSVCLYDNTMSTAKDVPYEMGHRVNLVASWDKLKHETAKGTYKSIDPHIQLLPDGTFAKTSGFYLIHPIFYADTHYGYILARFAGIDYTLYSLYLRIFSNAISQAFEYSGKVSENNNLSLQSLTDELTGVLNRRGFLNIASQTIDISVEKGMEGCVIFGDINGLKKINDNYGHEMGDRAIRAQARILKKAFKEHDVVGRLSGDEFAVVSVGMSLDEMDKYRESIETFTKEICREEDFPFELSISVGAVEFDSDKKDINRLLTLADEKQYKTKKEYHKKNG